MASIVKIKRSSVQGKAPTTSNIQEGELALNTRDGKLFSSDGSSVFEVGANLSSLYISDSSNTNVRVIVKNENENANTSTIAVYNDRNGSLELGITGSGYSDYDPDTGDIGYVYPSNTVGTFILGNQANTFIYGGAGFDGWNGNAAISITSSNNTASPRIGFLDKFYFPTTSGANGQILKIVNSDTKNLEWVTPSETLQSITENGNTTTMEITVGGLTAAGQKLPSADGAAGQVLKTDGNGDLFWDSVGSGAGTFQFYKNVGTPDLEADGIIVSGGEFPFYQQDGTYDPVPVT
jgi:hypothetical protein